jgi:hypothetical protein
VLVQLEKQMGRDLTEKKQLIRQLVTQALS